MSGPGYDEVHGTSQPLIRPPQEQQPNSRSSRISGLPIRNSVFSHIGAQRRSRSPDSDDPSYLSPPHSAPDSHSSDSIDYNPSTPWNVYDYQEQDSEWGKAKEEDVSVMSSWAHMDIQDIAAPLTLQPHDQPTAVTPKAEISTATSRWDTPSPEKREKTKEWRVRQIDEYFLEKYGMSPKKEMVKDLLAKGEGKNNSQFNQILQGSDGVMMAEFRQFKKEHDKTILKWREDPKQVHKANWGIRGPTPNDTTMGTTIQQQHQEEDRRKGLMADFRQFKKDHDKTIQRWREDPVPVSSVDWGFKGVYSPWDMTNDQLRQLILKKEDTCNQLDEGIHTLVHLIGQKDKELKALKAKKREMRVQIMNHPDYNDTQLTMTTDASSNHS